MNQIKDDVLNSVSGGVIAPGDPRYPTAKKVAYEILAGDYGNGEERRNKVTQLYGADMWYCAQDLVNWMYQNGKVLPG